MKFKDYYAVLGIAPDADDKAVKVAYKKLAREFHPDVSKHAEAGEKFKEIGEAYEVIHNKQQRAKYDELRRHQQNRARHQQGNTGSSHGNYQQQSDPQTDQEFSDFINSMFGGARGGFQQGRARAQKGQDVEIEFPVFLEETLVDTVKPVEFMLPQRDNNGRVSESKKSLKVKIPAGVVNGERIRLKGQGAPGSANGPNGDVYLQIRLVPHPLFDVEDHNLSIVVPLAPWEAALGTKLNLPTLSGKIQLTIPANSQSGQRLRVKGKGLVSKKHKGDLFALIKIVNPPTSNEASKILWADLAEKAQFDPRSKWSEST